jgi:hypothetical protein
MPLVNLTKRPLRLHATDGAVVELAPDARHVGLVATSEHRVVTGEGGHAFSLTVRRADGVKGLPDPAPDTVYVVPLEVAVAVPERADVAYPAETAAVRAPDGTTQQVTHLRRLVTGFGS